MLTKWHLQLVLDQYLKKAHWGSLSPTQGREGRSLSTKGHCTSSYHKTLSQTENKSPLKLYNKP